MVKNWLALSRTFTFEIWKKKKKFEKLFVSKISQKILKLEVFKFLNEFFLKPRLFFKNQTTHITLLNNMVILYKLKSYVWYGIFDKKISPKISKISQSYTQKKTHLSKKFPILVQKMKKIFKK